jgi:hypothetical protein
MVEREAKGLIELIPNFICTILTRTRGIIPDIARPTPLKETSHILPATLPLGRRKHVEFTGLTLHDPIMQLRRHHPTHQARERDKLVQPHAPELGDLGFRDGDAAEEGEDDDDEGVEEGGDESGGGEGGDRLAEGDGEELHDEDHEELIAGAGVGGLESGDVIEGEKERNSWEEWIRKRLAGGGGDEESELTT